MPSSEIVLRVSEPAGRIAAHVVDVNYPLWNEPPATTESAANPVKNAPRSSGRSIWALTDQGIVSLGNCGTNVLLARSMAAAQFGVFAILLEAILFLNSLQSALVIYPLSVRGAILDRAGLQRLAGTCLLLTALMSLPLGIALGIAGGVVGTLLTGSLAAIALATWQCQETLRRALMAHDRQRDTVAADAVSYLGQAAGIFALSVSGRLTVNAAFVVMALTSGAAVLVQSIQIGPTFKLRPRELAQTATDFWRLGRWVLLGNLTLLITTLGCSWTLVYFHGADAVGRFQALATLMKLSNPLTICMAGLIVPTAARAFREHGLSAAKSITLKYGLMTVGVIAPYFCFLLLLPSTAIRLVYGHNQSYADLGNQLRAFVIWYSALLVAQIGGCLLNAIEQSRRSFYAQGIQTAAVIILTIPLTAMYGLNGLMLGGVIGNVVMAVCYLSLVRKLSESPLEFYTRRIAFEMQASARAA